ncbi:MAG: Txe/YoeB family addiction module toxin [Providencia rettgeri]|jgi:toxin YoeB|nr:toxin YoeB [Eubacteriaceae bacterium]MDK2936760.1 toxin YoeB [Eubacteriaceae bacterium]
MNKLFSDFAWEEYLYWQQKDKKVLKKIHELLRDIERNGHAGIGKPEALRHELTGYWSRRITQNDRLIYKIQDETIYIISCSSHYGDK